jgi:hypothetical protein
MEAAKKTPAGETITPAPGDNQFFIEKGVPFTKILAADKAEKLLVFDVLEFPEISATNLGKLSQRARAAYQMDMRNSSSFAKNKEMGFQPYEERLKAIGDGDPLSRGHEDARKGKARKLPKGMKHMNVMPEEVEELERVGYKKADPDEVEIVGSTVKDGAVVLQDAKGKVGNVTMLVEDEAYKKHRKADRAKTQARLDSNVEATKERMKRFNPRVTIFDESDLTRKK